MATRIWVTYHKDSQIEEYGLKEDEIHTLYAAHKVVDGKNINHLNPVYSEMVTMWYVWKNKIKSDFVGFEHYRRRFNIFRKIGKGECIVRRIVDFAMESVYDQYCRAHKKEDMDIILRCIERRYGKDNPYTRHIKSTHWLISNCCFLMKWTDFNKMCAFMFPLLEDFAKECGISNTNVEEYRKKAVRDFGNERTEYQTRVQSFLAERLISAWISVNLTPYVEGREVAIVHYNTPELTEVALKSLDKHSPGCHVTIFDNSDKRPFKTKRRNVDIIDNTKGQVIDFGKELEKYDDRDMDDVRLSNFGSAKHSMSVDKLMDLLPDGFVLMDSDVVLRRSIYNVWKTDYACVGDTERKHNVPLLQPFLCYLNVPMLREKGVRYFNPRKMWALTKREPDRWYDTGAWLLEEVILKQMPIANIFLREYVEHFSHGSWRGNEERVKEWIEYNKVYWE
jgi:hypothetical protein